MNRTSPNTMRSARNAWRAAALVLIGMSTAGCGLSSKRDVQMTASIPTDYRQRHPITIQERDASIELFVGARRGGLTPAWLRPSLAQRRHRRHLDRCSAAIAECACGG
jgi:type IV pilus biogenesis protein CpaD/CtpE